MKSHLSWTYQFLPPQWSTLCQCRCSWKTILPSSWQPPSSWWKTLLWVGCLLFQVIVLLCDCFPCYGIHFRSDILPFESCCRNSYPFYVESFLLCLQVQTGRVRQKSMRQVRKKVKCYIVPTSLREISLLMGVNSV